MVTTRRHHVALLALAVAALLAVGCAKKDSAAPAPTTAAPSESTEAPKSTSTSPAGSARCTNEDLTKAADATLAGAKVSDVSCNSTGSRAVATVTAPGECAKGCAGYFIAKGSDWSLEGTQPADAAVDSAKFGDWSTLHASWKPKFDVTSGQAASGKTGGAPTTTSDVASPEDPTTTTTLLPPDASAYCQYYGPIPRCLQDPKYDPNTTTTPPPDPAAIP